MSEATISGFPANAAVRSEPAAAIAVRPAAGVGWQRLWLSAERRPWTTLALIPVGGDISTPRLADALADVGRQHLGGAVAVHDATGVTLVTLQAELGAVAERARSRERVIVALPDVLRSPASLAIARAADAAILCVALGRSAIAEAEQILDEVGRDRFLGSVALPRTKETP